MKILVYNFIQPDDPAKTLAGGVGVYQSNLISELLRRGHQVISLSAGDRHDFRRRPARLLVKESAYAKAWILNSPMLAPAHRSFNRISEYVSNNGLDGMPAQIRRRFGRIDVFHFQNVEGLTSGFFIHLKRIFPDARFILSAHNYNIVCPQVNLWQREKRACTDYRDGRACVNCLLSDPPANQEALARYAGFLRFWHIQTGSMIDRLLRFAVILTKRTVRQLTLKTVPVSRSKLTIMTDEKAENYKRYRLTNIALVTHTFDTVFAVSRRTQHILIDRGLPSDKVQVSYIGTAHFERFDRSLTKSHDGHGLHIAFLGYMRRDKGFYFLLQALASFPLEVSERISITVAAPMHDPRAVDRLKSIAHRFRAIQMFDGYSHAQLDQILEPVDLGIIPVLWEDNLPQVAIEMVSRNIAILCSNRGGAQEIASHADFTFKAGNHSDFVLRLSRILDGKVSLHDFFRKPPLLISMADHVDELMKHYGGSCDAETKPADIRAWPADR